MSGSPPPEPLSLRPFGPPNQPQASTPVVMGPRGPSWQLGAFADNAAAETAAARLATGLLEGHTYLNTSTHSFRVYQQGAWVDPDVAGQASASAAAASAVDAEESKTASAASASAAEQSEVNAGVAATNAAVSAVAAGQSEANAAVSAGAADASATAAQGSEVASGTHATAAAASEASAAASATAAAGSENNAHNSEVSAAAHATAAGASETNAASSLSAMQSIQLAAEGVVAGGNIFLSKAAMTAAVAGIASNAFALVLKDEARSSAATLYQKQSGSMVAVYDVTAGSPLF